MSLKKYLLLACQVLGLLVNTLAADGKYLVLNRDNLTTQICSRIFSAFLKSMLNFKNFEKKDDPHRFCISQIMESENVVRYMSEKSFFREPFEEQHGKLV